VILSHSATSDGARQFYSHNLNYWEGHRRQHRQDKVRELLLFGSFGGILTRLSQIYLVNVSKTPFSWPNLEADLGTMYGDSAVEIVGGVMGEVTASDGNEMGNADCCSVKVRNHGR